MSRKTVLLLLIILTCAAHGAVAEDQKPQWIIVTAPEFRDALAPLCERRRNDGMQVVFVETTDVLTPQQIRNRDGAPLKDRINQLCRQVKGTSYVMLVGAISVADSEQAVETVLPALVGTSGRMRGQPSDNGYGCLDKELLPTVAVGRFPVRTVDEARQLVDKTVAFERNIAPAEWQNRLTFVVGHPGGASVIERRFAESFLQGVAGSRFGKIHPLWQARILIHGAGSPFTVADGRLRETSLRYLEDGQMFSVYLGHSNATGLWSDNAEFLNRDDWAKLKIPNGAGVLFTCGCFGCQLQGRDGEGYGLAAVRNPHGPVAVIGSHGESYAALGQLAGDGMLNCLASPEPPTRLGDYVLAAKQGIARGPIDGLTFWLYDQGDGSRGTVPLDQQRLEHQEMWMLLGDPALKLPMRVPAINLESTGKASAGSTIVVTGSIPTVFSNETVHVMLERPMGSRSTGLEPLPKDSAKADDIKMANHERANTIVLQSYDVRPRDARFECTIELPKELPWPRLTIRAVASMKGQTAEGVLSVVVTKK
jgi:hypothetical protein